MIELDQAAAIVGGCCAHCDDLVDERLALLDEAGLLRRPDDPEVHVEVTTQGSTCIVKVAGQVVFNGVGLEHALQRDESRAEVKRLRAAMTDLVRASACAAGIAIEDGSEVSFRQIVDGLIGLVERCRTAEVEVERLRAGIEALTYALGPGLPTTDRRVWDATRSASEMAHDLLNPTKEDS